MKTILKDVPLFLLIASIAIGLTSCYKKFYTVAQNPNSRSLDTSALEKPGKYYILRAGDRAFSLRDVVLAADQSSLQCTLGEVDRAHTVYLNSDAEKGLIYKASKGQSVVLDEVHIYVPPDSSVRAGSKYVLNLSTIIKMEVIKEDKKKTNESTIESTVGIALGVVLIAAIAYTSAVSSIGSMTW